MLENRRLATDRSPIEDPAQDPIVDETVRLSPFWRQRRSQVEYALTGAVNRSSHFLAI